MAFAPVLAVVASSLVAGALGQCGSPQRDHVNCAAWKSQGFCTNSFYSAAQRQMYCGTSCGLCKSCPDADPKCPNYVASGFCMNRFYTDAQKAQFCAGSCNLCGTSPGGQETTPAAADSTTSVGATGKCTTTQATAGDVEVPGTGTEQPSGASAADPITAVVLDTGCTLTLKDSAAAGADKVIATAADFVAGDPSTEYDTVSCACV